jgi:hypothetical protein
MGAGAFWWGLMAFLCWQTMSGQGRREEWKQKAFDLDAHLTYSLANAPLADAERNQIIEAMDDKTIHDSFSNAERDKEREAILRARVGWIMLADTGSEQLVVRGTFPLCGATGNCSVWIFARESERLRLLLRTGGSVFIVSANSSQGFHDIVTGWHVSAFETGFGLYRWDGIRYKQSDSYCVQFAADDREKPPAIKDCPPSPPQNSLSAERLLPHQTAY